MNVDMPAGNVIPLRGRFLAMVIAPVGDKGI